MKIAGMLFIILSVIGFVFYFYYKETQKTIMQLSTNNAILEVAANMNEDAINELQKDYALANEILENINKELSDARVQNRQLVDRLSRHELGALAAARPVLVERIINNATAAANRCMELLTGAELNDKELSAKNAREFNSECQFLWPGNL